MYVSFPILSSGALQDTYLLATQQEVTLSAELAAAVETRSPSSQGDSADDNLPVGTSGLMRRRLFCHRSALVRPHLKYLKVLD